MKDWIGNIQNDIETIKSAEKSEISRGLNTKPIPSFDKVPPPAISIPDIISRDLDIVYSSGQKADPPQDAPKPLELDIAALAKEIIQADLDILEQNTMTKRQLEVFTQFEKIIDRAIGSSTAFRWMSQAKTDTQLKTLVN